LHATWSRRGCTPIVPTSSDRGSVKVFGCIDIFEARFDYRFEEGQFEAETYLDFLEKVIAKKYYPRSVFYIQDNAPYHKDGTVWEWFKENRSWLHVKNLPPYCPELNATEFIWNFTRIEGIHNQYFDSKDEIINSLKSVFSEIKRNPKRIQGYIQPFL
jgi:transposase